MAEAAAKAEAERREEERLKAMEMLVVASAESVVPGLSLGLALVPAQSNDALDELAAVRLTGLLKTEAPSQVQVIHPMFADGFYSEGHFAKPYGGDPAPLRDSGSLTRVSKLALGRVSADCMPNPTMRDMVACDVSFAYKIFDDSGSVADANQLTGRGPGLNDTNGVERGVQLLIEHHADELFRIFGR